MTEPIEITREEYERLWGHLPPGDAIGVAMQNDSGIVLAYYKFVGKTHEEIQELESLLRGEKAQPQGKENL